MTDHGKEPTMGHFLTRLGVYAANPLAFLVLIVYAALWIAFKPETSSGMQWPPWQPGP